MAKLITRGGTSEHQVVSREEWLIARKKLLEEEKELFRLHDRLKARLPKQTRGQAPSARSRAIRASARASGR